jgi:hypothetical protein
MIRAGSLPLALVLSLAAAEAMAQFPAAAPGQFPSTAAPAPAPFPSAPAPGGFPSSAAPAPAPFPGQSAAPAPFPGQGAGFPGQGAGFPGQGAAPPQGGGQPPPCVVEFMGLREQAQKRAGVVRAASERKATPEEACKLIGHFIEAEAKVVRFVEKNAASCGIPADAVKSMRQGHGKSLELRKRVCTAAAQAPKGTAGPSLSESLGTSRVVDPGDRKLGTGTLDTLTGPVLTR